MDGNNKFSNGGGREPIATNTLLARIVAEERAPMPRSAIAATHQYRARERATHSVGFAIEAIADLPVSQRAGFIMAITQGVIELTGRGNARAELLEKVFVDTVNLADREIVSNQTWMPKKGSRS